MLKIGVHELKNQLTQIVRTVHEEQAKYVVTVHGEPVALLCPFTHVEQTRLPHMEIQEEMKALQTLAEQIGAVWVSPKSVLEILDETRDEQWQS